MTDDRKVERLAALDAGLLDPEEAAAVRAAAADDPRSAAVLQALAATRAELAGLPAPTAPPQVRQRWAAALEAEGARPRSPGRAPAVLRRVAAAAAVLAVAATGLLLVSGPEAAPPPVVALARVDLAGAGTAAVGVADLGPLADPARRAACLRAIGPTGARADDAVLGGRRVLLEGQPGVLVVLATGTLGRFRLVVVDPACGAAGGTLLAEVVVGG
jgi:anti-sigma factor RsiW